MYKYRVVELWPDENRLALRCNMGRYHLARALNALPRAEAVLHGAAPHLGFGLLQCPVKGTIFRTIFESINQADFAPRLGAMRHAAHAARAAGVGVAQASD